MNTVEKIRPRALTADELAVVLRAAAVAAGDYRAEAATELLIRHRRWLTELEAVDQLVDVADQFGEDVSMNWSAAAQISSSDLGDPEDRAVLAIAASIARFDEPVDLFARLAPLRRDTVDLVLAAISHATGAHHHVEHLGAPSEAGEWTVTPTSPRVQAGALHPWPAQQV